MPRSVRLDTFFESLRARDNTLTSPHPLQRPEYYFPGLPPARPWHRRREHPWVRSLDAAADVIRDEWLRARSFGALHPAQDALVEGGAWRSSPIVMGLHVSQSGRHSFPRTAELVLGLPGLFGAGLVYFSTLEPRTRVRAHCGPSNLRLRCHLPLCVPPGARLRVGSRWRALQDGRSVVFDDSFEHEAENPSERPRTVLILDFWHPALTAQEREVLAPWLARAVYVSRRDQAERAEVVDWAEVGALRGFSDG